MNSDSDHLLRTVNAVGGFEVSTDASGHTVEERYVLGDEGLECLKDIKQLLRRDDRTDDKPLLLNLGQWKFIQSDLIPILLSLTTQDGTSVQGTLMAVSTLPLHLFQP